MKVGDLLSILQCIRELLLIRGGRRAIVDPMMYRRTIVDPIMYRRTMVDPMMYRRTIVDPMSFRRTKINPLMVGELLLIL